MTNPTIKYRPQLTLTQITKILSLAQSESPLTPESKSLIKTLAPFKTKAENGAVVGNIVQNSGSLSERIGFESPISNPVPKITPESLYELWKLGETLSILQLELVHQYRYESNLMHPEEESKYENSLLSSLKS